MNDQSQSSPFAGAGFSDDVLRTFYGRSQGPIAFIDESYRAPKQALGGGNSFYVLSAVVVDRTRLTVIRSKLLEIAADTRWHSSESAKDERGREKLIKMARFLAKAAMHVVAVQAPIDPADRDAEAARAACFHALLTGLCSVHLAPNGLVVYEQRPPGALQDADRKTIASARAARKMHPNLIAHAGSPATEALLWAPDVVSWSVRQRIAFDTTTYVEPFYAQKSLKQITVP